MSIYLHERKSMGRYLTVIYDMSENAKMESMQLILIEAMYDFKRWIYSFKFSLQVANSYLSYKSIILTDMEDAGPA